MGSEVTTTSADALNILGNIISLWCLVAANGVVAVANGAAVTDANGAVAVANGAAVTLLMVALAGGGGIAEVGLFIVCFFVVHHVVVVALLLGFRTT